MGNKKEALKEAGQVAGGIALVLGVMVAFVSGCVGAAFGVHSASLAAGISPLWAGVLGILSAAGVAVGGLTTMVLHSEIWDGIKKVFGKKEPEIQRSTYYNSPEYQKFAQEKQQRLQDFVQKKITEQEFNKQAVPSRNTLPPKCYPSLTKDLLEDLKEQRRKDDAAAAGPAPQQ